MPGETVLMQKQEIKHLHRGLRVELDLSALLIVNEAQNTLFVDFYSLVMPDLSLGYQYCHDGLLLFLM
jgi:hypothetical protein